MALRILLVGLVIGLGVDLPSGAEVAAWARAGDEWVRARLDGVFGAEEVAEAKPSADAEFAAVVDEMAGAFTADLAAMERPASRSRLAFEPIVVSDDPEPGLGFALNRDAQGRGQDPEPVPAPTVATASPESATASRLASAVRLTREAASAWMTVLRGAEATVRIR